MSFKKTLVLAVVLIAAAFYIQQVLLPGEKAKSRAGFALGGKPLAEFTAIEGSSANDKYLLVNTAPAIPGSIAAKASQSADSAPSAADDAVADKARQGSWEVAGVDYKAVDPTTVTALIKSLEELSLESEIPAADVASDLKVYGLSEPEVVIAVVHPQAGRQEYRFGKLNEYVRERYMQVGAGGAVYLVPERIFAALKRESRDIRNKNPIAFADGEVDSIEILGGKEDLKFGLQENKWQILSPIQAKASEAAITALTRALRNFRVGDFLDQVRADSPQFGLDKPEAQVRIKFKQDKNRPDLLVRVGSRKIEGQPDSASKEKNVAAAEEFFFSVDELNTVFRLIGPDPVKALVRPAIDFRERKLFSFPIELAKQLSVNGVVDGITGKVALTLQGEEWLVDGKQGDQVFVKQYIKSLAELSASEFLPDDFDIAVKDPTLTALITTAEPGSKAVGAGEGSEDRLEYRLEIYPAENSVKEKDRYLAKAFLPGVEAPEWFVITKDSLIKIIPKVDSLFPVAQEGTASEN